MNSIFLQAKNAQTRTNSNCRKPNVSKNSSLIFDKRKRSTSGLVFPTLSDSPCSDLPMNALKSNVAWTMRVHYILREEFPQFPTMDMDLIFGMQRQFSANQVIILFQNYVRKIDVFLQKLKKHEFYFFASLKNLKKYGFHFLQA